MAGMNRYFFGVQSRKHALKMVHGKVAIGASGAPTLSAGASSGISSISRTAAGTYEVTLDGKLPQLVGFHCMVVDDAASQVTHFQVLSDAVSATGKLTFACLAPTDASTTTSIATDPAEGAVLLFTVLVNNTSLDQ